jgi:folate-binding protein YgfZ
MAERDDVAAVELADRGFLELGGGEAKGFLQGLVTNDLDDLAPDRALWAALLTPQGKYLFDFFLYERDGRILLDGEAERLSELERRLVMYRLRAPVEIGRPEPALGVMAVIAADEAGKVPPVLMRAATDRGLLAVTDPRAPALGARVVGRPGDLHSFLEALGISLVGSTALDQRRIRLGAPDGSRDLVVQKSILLESNFDLLNGVAFDKGCFVGQELTARTKYRGLVKKRLLPVRLDGPAPEAGTPVLAGDREVGELRSRAGDLALALLRLDAVAERPTDLRAGAARLELLSSALPSA